MPWQEEDAAWVTQQNSLLAHDCGLGKTLIAVEAGKRYLRGRRGAKVLVVCPRLSKEWWAEVIEAQDAGFAGICGRAGRLPRAQWRKLATYNGDKPAWLIVHPTAVRMAVQDLASFDWDAIIVDEAHRFKNRKAQQTKALRKITADWKLMLTATPYGKAPDDMWALLRWLYPHRYTSYWRFYEQYVEYVPIQVSRRTVKKKLGPKDLPALAKEVEPFYLRRTKDEILDLPPVTYQDRPVAIGGVQEKLYLKLVREAYAELYGKEVILENSLVRIMRLQQCSLDPALMAPGLPDLIKGQTPAKVEWLQDWLEDNPNEPTVITSRYRTFVEKWLVDLAPGAVIVGGMKGHEVQAALKNFQRTGRLVGSLDAIKESLNLQRASTLIVMDGKWSSVDEYQLRNRIHRMGQTRPCTVIHLVGKLASNKKYTVDKLMRRAVQQKLSEAELLNEFIRSLKGW